MSEKEYGTMTIPLGQRMITNSLYLPKVFPQERWERVLNSTVQQIQHLAKVKGGEYAGDDDRLANFRRNARALALPMETVWGVYAAKHWDALTQYISDIQSGKDRPRSEPIAGRVDDLLVYLILFKAIIDEREGDPK